MQMVQTVDEINQIVTLVRCGMIERVRWHMQEFVGQPVALGLKYFLRILALGQEFFGTLQLMTPVLLGLITQRADGRNELP